MIDILIDLYQQGRIREAESTARRAGDKAGDLQSEVRSLADRLDRLTLISQAMWELLRERTNLSSDQIIAKIQEVDLRDGAQDGKMGRKVFTCKSCGQKVSSSHRKCIYCGEPAIASEIFNTA
jgi:hypothetical protein